MKQSVWSVEETVTEGWFPGKFYEASIKYDYFFGSTMASRSLCVAHGTQDMIPPGSVDQRPVRPELSAPIYQEYPPIQGAK